jgi:hypothetical protein
LFHTLRVTKVCDCEYCGGRSILSHNCTRGVPHAVPCSAIALHFASISLAQLEHKSTNLQHRDARDCLYRLITCLIAVAICPRISNQIYCFHICPSYPRFHSFHSTFLISYNSHVLPLRYPFVFRAPEHYKIPCFIYHQSSCYCATILLCIALALLCDPAASPPCPSLSGPLSLGFIAPLLKHHRSTEQKLLHDRPEAIGPYTRSFPRARQ